MKRRVGVLISGRGSNLAALARAAEAPDYPAEIALVISNRADAAGLRYSANPRVIEHRPFGQDRIAHEAAIDAALRETRIEFVCLAGYMRLLTPFLVRRWAGRMLNVHPSLLPAFPGLDTHRRALAAGVKIHGCTVHYVTDTTDDGPIIAQAAVPVLPGDDEETLAARVLAEEHRVYPLALALAATGRTGRPADVSAALRNPLPDMQNLA
jgi:phosphoribosylglycinamide formyltransferase 1